MAFWNGNFWFRFGTHPSGCQWLNCPLHQVTCFAWLLGGRSPRSAFATTVPSLILLSSVGVMLLLFFLGMEFDWRRLLTSPHRLLVTAADLALNFVLPFTLFLALGLPYPAAFVIAMALYPTSSAITISALLQFRRLANPETETIVWVLVGEDLAIIALLAIASGLTGEGIGLTSVATAFAFILVMLVASVVLTRPLEWLFERIPSELDNLITLGIIVFVKRDSLHASLVGSVGCVFGRVAFRRDERPRGVGAKASCSA